MSIVRTNDANNANTNRHVRFLVEAETSTAADLFVALQGPQNAYPYYGKIQAPTLAQELAQLRLSLITRILTRWAILVGVQVATDTAANAGGALILTYEQDEMGVFYDNAWGSAPGVADKHSEEGSPGVGVAGEITDTVGVGGLVTGPKGKPGLQQLLDLEAATVTYDGGQSGPFGTLSYTGGTGTNTRAGDVELPDGRVVPVAQVLPLDIGGGAASGLTVSFLAQ